MITDNKKKDILRLIELARIELGSYNKVAEKCGVNTATVTNNMMKPENWASVSDKMWIKVGGLLGYKFSGGWVTVETTNLKLMKKVFEMAQNFGEMKCISHPAGGGKTQAVDWYKSEDKDGAVVVFKCEKWSHREFMLRLASNLGIEIENTKNLYSLADEVIRFFKNKVLTCSPLLIIDQADKLPNRSLGFLIQFYNELKYECGCVLVGTEHLAKKIKSGVKRSLENFDELDDRLGRNYVSLIGFTHEDVTEICTANGISNKEEIEQIWQDLKPEQVQFGNKYIRVVKSGRRLETVIVNRHKRSLNMN